MNPALAPDRPLRVLVVDDEALARSRLVTLLGDCRKPSAVVQAQAAFTAAERDHQRARELVAQGFFPQQKLDDARRVLDTARSALDSARVQARANRPGGMEPQLASQRLTQAEAAVNRLEQRA